MCLIPLLLCGCTGGGILNIKKPKYQEVNVDEAIFENKFYYEQLSEDGQLIYRELYQGVQDYKKEITIHGTDGEFAGTLLQYIVYDFPEIFWLEGSCTTVVYENTHTVLEPIYNHTSEERDVMQVEIEEAADEILAQIPSENSDYEKIKAVYEILINEVAYVEGAEENQNIYSSLVKKASVCAGYARAIQYLLNKLDIYCIYVVGTADGESHAWNIVNCNGNMYNVDATWGDPLFKGEKKDTEIMYDFLCCSQAAIDSTHTKDARFDYPSCTSNDLEYYRMNQMYYESADEKTLLKAMYHSIDAKEDCTIFKFASRELYEDARNLLTSKLLEDAAQYLGRTYSINEINCRYSELASFNRLVIYWSYK